MTMFRFISRFTPSLISFVNANDNVPASITRHALVVFLVVPNLTIFRWGLIKIEMFVSLIVSPWRESWGDPNLEKNWASGKWNWNWKWKLKFAYQNKVKQEVWFVMQLYHRFLTTYIIWNKSLFVDNRLI